MNIKLISILFIYIYIINYSVYSKECCHSGNLILSSGYCKEKNFKYIKLGNNNEISPCEESKSETISWGYQTLLDNSTYSWFECQLKDKDEIYYQIGGCGEHGIVKRENRIKFSNYEQFFSMLSCIKVDGNSNTIFGYVISSSLRALENAIYSYKSVCYQTGYDYYLFDIWEYGNDIDCTPSHDSTNCTCAKEYNKINGSCKTSYPYSNSATTSINQLRTFGRLDPICNGHKCHYRRANNSNKLKWMIPTIIFSTIGGILLIAGLIYLIKRSRNHDFDSPLLG